MRILDRDNRLFTLARLARRPPSALEAIAVVLVTLALVIAGQMLARSFLQVGSQSMARPIVQNIVGFLPIYLALWIWLRWRTKRPFQSLGLENSRGAPRRVLRGILVGGLMITVTAGLATIPGATLLARSQTSGLATLGIGLLSLLSYAVQGPAEEVLFRGWLLPAIGSRHSPLVGVLVSSVVFSAAHSLNPDITRLGFLNLFLFGVFTAVYSLAEGGIWGACAWHATWNWEMNWALGKLFGFDLATPPQSGLLISVRATGPRMITGGDFGLEGGLAATAVFLVGIGVVCILPNAAANDDVGER
jgi:membrane protease YdiL (CAAX protease family)